MRKFFREKFQPNEKVIWEQRHKPLSLFGAVREAKLWEENV